MEWYEEEVRNLERQTVASPPPSPNIAFYGSSSIRLWNSLQQDFAGMPVINRGFGGSTMDACSWFFHRLVVPLHPSALILYAGDNDLGDGRSPEQVLQSYRCLAEQVRNHLGTIPFLFVSIKLSPARQGLVESIRKTNELIRREHTQARNNIYVDVFEPMLDRNGLPRPKLYAEDGLHLSAPGYALWTSILSNYQHLWL